MEPVLAALFFIFFPVFVLLACQKIPMLGKIGAAVLCYGVGILLGVLGLVPESAKALQEPLMSVTVPLAIPLMLFSMDLKRWSRLAGKTLLSFLLVLIAAMAAAFVGYWIFRDRVEEGWKVAGMLVGVYTGGSPNLNAIGLALKAKEHVLVLANAGDVLVSAVWFFASLAFFQRFCNLFLPSFKEANAAESIEGEREAVVAAKDENLDFVSYAGIFRRKTVLPLLGAFGLTVLIFAIGAGLYSITPKAYNMTVLMLSITTLGIACSFVPKIRNIEMTFHLGQYFILIFCLVVATMVDLQLLFSAAPAVIMLTVVVVWGAWILHLVLAAIFRIDTDTVIITATAAIMSPPFVPVTAAALKNKDVVVSGLATGILGYAVGNYLGIALAHLARVVFS